MTARVIAVDWSGAKTGSGRKIALAEARDGALISVEGGLTREDVVARLTEYAGEGPVVAGLDFGFSLPAWYLQQLGVRQAHDYWRELAHGDAADDLLRQCADPFWGRKGRRKPALHEHFRKTESALMNIDLRPKSVFQIAGAGAVGTGSIRGMRSLHQLSEAGFAVWPFDDPRLPVVLEIYPRLFYHRTLTKSHALDRRAYVEEEPGVPAQLRDAASSTEDTFDAAVSAITMSQHAADLLTLPRIEEPTLRLEGVIWWPGWRAAHGV